MIDENNIELEQTAEELQAILNLAVVKDSNGLTTQEAGGYNFKQDGETAELLEQSSSSFSDYNQDVSVVKLTGCAGNYLFNGTKVLFDGFSSQLYTVVNGIDPNEIVVYPGISEEIPAGTKVLFYDLRQVNNVDQKLMPTTFVDSVMVTDSYPLDKESGALLGTCKFKQAYNKGAESVEFKEVTPTTLEGTTEFYILLSDGANAPLVQLVQKDEENSTDTDTIYTVYNGLLRNVYEHDGVQIIDPLQFVNTVNRSMSAIVNTAIMKNFADGIEKDYHRKTAIDSDTFEYVDGKLTLKLQVGSAEHRVEPDEASRLALEQRDDLIIVDQEDDPDHTYYLNPGLDPSDPDNWDARPKLSEVTSDNVDFTDKGTLENFNLALIDGVIGKVPKGSATPIDDFTPVDTPATNTPISDEITADKSVFWSMSEGVLYLKDKATNVVEPIHEIGTVRVNDNGVFHVPDKDANEWTGIRTDITKDKGVVRTSTPTLELQTDSSNKVPVRIEGDKVLSKTIVPIADLYGSTAEDELGTKEAPWHAVTAKEAVFQDEETDDNFVSIVLKGGKLFSKDADSNYTALGESDREESPTDSVKTFVIDLISNQGSLTNIGLRKIELYNGGHKLNLDTGDYSAYSNTASEDTLTTSGLFRSDRLIDSNVTNQATRYAAISGVRITVVFNSLKTFDEIRIYNYNDEGTNDKNMGVKACKVYVTDQAYTDVNYQDDLGILEEIFDGDLSLYFDHNQYKEIDTAGAPKNQFDKLYVTEIWSFDGSVKFSSPYSDGIMLTPKIYLEEGLYPKDNDALDFGDADNPFNDFYLKGVKLVSTTTNSILAEFKSSPTSSTLKIGEAFSISNGADKKIVSFESDSQDLTIHGHLTVGDSVVCNIGSGASPVNNIASKRYSLVNESEQQLIQLSQQGGYSRLNVKQDFYISTSDNTSILKFNDDSTTIALYGSINPSVAGNSNLGKASKPFNDLFAKNYRVINPLNGTQLLGMFSGDSYSYMQASKDFVFRGASGSNVFGVLENSPTSLTIYSTLLPDVSRGANIGIADLPFDNQYIETVHFHYDAGSTSEAGYIDADSTQWEFVGKKDWILKRYYNNTTYNVLKSGNSGGLYLNTTLLPEATNINIGSSTNGQRFNVVWAKYVDVDAYFAVGGYRIGDNFKIHSSSYDFWKMTHGSGGSVIRPVNANSHTVSLGANSSSYRFDYCYLKRSPNVSSDIRLKDVLEDMPKEFYLEWIEYVEQKIYHLKDDVKEDRDTYFGYIADDIKALCEKWNIGNTSLWNYKDEEDNGTDNDDYLSITRDECLMVETKALRLKNRLLESRVEKLETTLQQLLNQ